MESDQLHIAPERCRPWHHGGVAICKCTKLKVSVFRLSSSEDG